MSMLIWKISGDGMSKDTTNITVVIPTVYKENRTDLTQAISSLCQRVPSSVRLTIIIFVDRAAPNFKPRQFLKSLSVPIQQLQCLWSPIPVGFTGAINQSLQIARHQPSKPDWCLVFNDDAVAKPNFWKIFSLLNKQQSGVVSCAIATKGGLIDSCGLAQTKWGVTLPITSTNSDAISQLFAGTCFFVHTATINHLFDQCGFFFFPLFFAYAEDFELSVRLNRLQMPVMVDSVVRVIHAGSATAGRGSFFQLFHGLRNDLWVHILHQYGTGVSMWYGIRYLLYVCLLSVYKGYWLLPLKILGSTFKNRTTLWYWRKQYDQKLVHRYSF